MTNNIHALMGNANNLDAVFCNGIKNQMSPFWKTIITRFNIISSFTDLWVF